MGEYAGGEKLQTAWRWAALSCVILAAAHAVLLASLRLYPFVDLPNHLASATILRFAGQPGNRLAEFYTVPTLFKPNVTHLAFCGLPIFPTVETANAVFFAAYAVLVPLIMLLSLRALGGNPWFGLLSFLPLYNFNVGWGLVDSVAAIPLTLLLFLLLVRHFERPTAWTSAAASAALALIFFAHAQALLFGLVLFGAMAVVRFRGSVGRTVRHLLLAVPAVAVFGVWWVRDWARTEPSGNSMGTFQALREYYLHGYLRSFPHRLSPLAFADNTFLGKSPWELAVEGAFFGLLCLLAIVALRRKLQVRDATSGWSRLEAPLVLLGCSTACYFFLPEDLPGHQFVSQRFAVFVLLAIALTAGVMAERFVGRIAIGAIAAAALLHLVVWSSYFFAFQDACAGFDHRVLPPADRGPMAALIYDRYFRGQPVFIHFPNYQIIWNRGLATTKLVDFRFGVVRRRVSTDVLPVYHDWVGPEDPYRGWYAALPAIVVRGTIPEADRAYLDGFEVAASAGAWSLFERHDARAAP
jgi:hypothetical protein